MLCRLVPEIYDITFYDVDVTVDTIILSVFYIFHTVFGMVSSISKANNYFNARYSHTYGKVHKNVMI